MEKVLMGLRMYKEFRVDRKIMDGVMIQNI